ncbi:Ig-like domain-containing protein [Glaciecola sp. KUL10]|uniref:Ig-like domain-containing protein n=1 Tax=Glaciecola sp. (strain KUL10) TaxID=2161813 RepID=UPI000D783170|nr:Ig-like domain-containing protein [Glaciecola sp. KUL10]GBL03049.1 invasin domain protein [Glaciecola sp. KUL10]
MKTFRQLLILMFVSVLLAACGGGGSLERNETTTPTNPDPDPAPTVSYTISLQISDQAGNSDNILGETSPLLVTATVTDQDGNAAADRLVTFSFSVADLANFDNDTGTALTNEQGVASIGLVVAEQSGDGLVNADVENGTQAQIGFRSQGIQQQLSTPSSLRLFASATQIASSGADEIELIAEVKNAQNILLSGVDVSFSANSNASLEIIDAQTRDDGTARALLKTTNNQENRQILARAITETLEDEVEVSVVGTEVNISGASSVIISDQVPYTILLADSNGQGISNQVVEITSTIGEVDNASPVTGSTGQVTVNFSSSISGQGSITANSLNASGTIELVVQEDDFSFSQLPTEAIPVVSQLSDEGSAIVGVTWFKDGDPFVGGAVTVTSSRGVITVPTMVTDVNGSASFEIKSTTAGPATLSAIGIDDSGNEVTSRATFEFVATSVQAIFIDASPDLIGPEAEQSNISAIVTDPNGNLVKGKLVNFSLVDASGGSIEPNSATTDSNGIASVTYTSNGISVEDGVIISAESDGVTNQTELTVGARAFDISLGTGNLIESPDSSTYLKEFAVFVSDSVGRPVEDIELTASVTPIKFAVGGVYRKGDWSFNPVTEDWFIDLDPLVTITCPNEDVNGNGSIDVDPNDPSITEDTNGDGELTPGIIGTINFKDGIARTDANGQATLQYRFPRAYGGWLNMEIAVFGQSSGSEAQSSQVYRLEVSDEDISGDNSPPASPFGIDPVCPTRS